MADRVGVINKGALMLVEDKKELMKKLGKKQLTLHLATALRQIPAELQSWDLDLRAEGHDLVYSANSADGVDISMLLKRLSELGIVIKDLQTHQSSLEDIFVNLVSERA
jgi:ABC-2 type transport system ATP-binding protein